MYIYTIKNLVNGKMYVGQTIQANAKMRWYSHCDMVRKGKKSHLYDSMRKHGIEKFLWEIVERANTIEELNELEAKWLAHYRILGEVYNNREAGGNKLHSTESIEKMKQVHKLRHANNVIGGWKRRDGGPMKGKNHKAESKIKSSLSNKLFYASLLEPKKLTEEHKRKVSESGKLAWAKRKALKEVS
jgi:group I intron endonuclease